MQLARLRQEVSHEEVSKHSEGESMLSRAVVLRTEQRQLRQEISDWQREARVALQTAVNSEARWGQSDQALRSELCVHQDRLELAREEMQSVSATCLEDDPEDVLQDCRQECQQMAKEAEEYSESRSACEELSLHLGSRISRLEEEMCRARSTMPADRLARQVKMTPEDVHLLRGEVKVLQAKVTLMKEEVGDEARALWLTSETELPRLRMRERERRKLQSMLSQARWDRDNLQREYDRVLRGLREQEECQMANEQEMAQDIGSTRAEGEEMIAAMRRTGLRLAEMRHDSWETESFMHHLTDQMERLEKERNKLRASFIMRPPGSGQRSALADMDPDTQEASLAWMQQDNQRLVCELREAAMRDEEEAQVVGDNCMEMEVRLVKVEERNIEMRTEVAALAPILRGGVIPD